MDDGDKFILALPTAIAVDVKPRSLEYKIGVGANRPMKSFPGGLYANFPNATRHELDQFYNELTGHARSAMVSAPSDWTVSFTTQTALTKEECAYALETLAAWSDALGNKLK